MSHTWHYSGRAITTYLPGDPEPDAAEAVTASGRWYKNGRGWQHELAATDMGDLTWDELLEIFGEVHVREEGR